MAKADAAVIWRNNGVGPEGQGLGGEQGGHIVEEQLVLQDAAGGDHGLDAVDGGEGEQRGPGGGRGVLGMVPVEDGDDGQDDGD